MTANTIFYPPLHFRTLPEMLQRVTREYQDKVAFVTQDGDGQEAVTYAQLARDVQKFVMIYRDKFAGRTRHVAIIGGNSYEWVVHVLSLWYLGQVVVPLNPKMSPEELQVALKRVRADLIFTDQKEDEILSFDIPVITFADFTFSGVLRNRDTIPLWLEEANEQVTEETLALLLFTSGTTGRPKIVPLTHGNLLAEVAGLSEFIQFHEARYVSILPLYHIFGLTTDLLLQLAFGACGYFPDLSAKSLPQALALARPTHVMVPPVLLTQALRMTKNVREFWGASVERLIVGGDKLPAEVIEKYGEVGITVLQGYGITECAPVIAFNPARGNRPGSIGLPLRSVETRLEEKDENGMGELLVRGKSVARGYYQDTRRTKEAFVDGWFHTGDLVRQDADGYLYIVGRKKNLLVVEGHQVSPEMIEEKLTRYSEIDQALVRRKPRSQKLEALLVAGTTAQRLQEIRDEVNRELSDWARIEGFNLVKCLPRTGLGKVRRC